ncbi:MAG TPA: TQO small subunit DoxD [Ignavibacteria bacterium]|nr:TQO small subunit DoxD [Ignavibacteria bacterium]
MSLFFKAHGKPSIGLLLIRLVVGTYTMSLGIMQASNIEDYINKVKAFQFFSENTAFIIGFITPFLLIIFGGLYIMGFFTPITSFSLALISIVKIASRGFFPTEGIPFNKDLLFLVCFLTTLFAGAGIISFDALLDRKKKKNVIEPVDKNVIPETKTITAEVIVEPLNEVKEEEEKIIP